MMDGQHDVWHVEARAHSRERRNATGPTTASNCDIVIQTLLSGTFCKVKTVRHGLIRRYQIIQKTSESSLLS
jgi:hypothetical protein